MEGLQQETPIEKEPIGLEEAHSGELKEIGPAASKKGKAGLAAVLFFSLMTAAGCAVDKNGKPDFGKTLDRVGEWASREMHEASVDTRNSIGRTTVRDSSYSSSAHVVLTPQGLRGSTSESRSGTDSNIADSKNPFKNINNKK